MVRLELFRDIVVASVEDICGLGIESFRSGSVRRQARTGETGLGIPGRPVLRLDNGNTMTDWYEKKTFGSLPDAVAGRYGDREALCFKEQRYTFTEVAGHIDEVAKGLMQAGVQSGDKVCLWLNNCPEWIFSMFALAKIGAVQVPVNTRFRTNDLEYVLRQCNATTLITHTTSGPIDYLAMAGELLPLKDAAPGAEIASEAFPHMKRVVIVSGEQRPGTLSWPEMLAAGRQVSDGGLRSRAQGVDPDDTVFIIYTSGTTGFPKGVMHSHKLLRNVEDRANRMGITCNDVFLNYLPLFHLFGYSEGALMSMVTGMRQVLTETFVADECIALVERDKCTILCGFETHLKDLVEAQQRNPRDLSSLRVGLFAAGMHSATAICRKAAEVLAPMVQFTGYGMSEMGVGSLLSSLDSTLDQRSESSGYPMQGYRCRVIDPETGEDRPTGEQGELLFKGYSLMQGYYNKPEETAQCYDADGWFHTGDMGELREDGYIRFVGRYKDMLKIGGENVDPMEVEGFLLQHPGIHQVAVVGYPDDRLTEVAVAFVQSQPQVGLSAEDVIAYCKGKIASFKIPKHVLFIEDLPMTASGKVQKVKLREQALSLIKPV